MRALAAGLVVIAAGCTLVYDPGKLPGEPSDGGAPADAAEVDGPRVPPPAVDAALCPPRTIESGPECVAARRVFVSSSKGNAAIGSAALADVNCNELASDANLGGVWMAWISEKDSTPETRFSQADDPYVRLDGVVIASDWDVLVGGALEAGITLTEGGNDVAGQEVWTGTDADGTETGDDCGKWTNNTGGLPYATVGLAGAVDENWTNTFTQFCNRNDQRIYCFEQ